MKILYRQREAANSDSMSPLERAGITQCYLKSMSTKDRNTSIRNLHHHTGYEIHIVTHGYHVYNTESDSIRVNEGELVLISPFIKHFPADEASDSKKQTLTFVISKNSEFSRIAKIPPYKHMKIPPQMLDAIKAIENEERSSSYLSDKIIENRILECVIYLMRNFIQHRNNHKSATDEETDARVMLAKQYIKDNINRAISVSEVASYCCISAKQLSRLFLATENISVTDYIRHHRCVCIEDMLENTTLSLKEISEAMNFNNEYYFNTFFKKHSGMTPGVYRRSMQKNG